MKLKIIYLSLNGVRNIILYVKIYCFNGVFIVNKNLLNGYIYKYGMYIFVVGVDNNVFYLISWGSLECDVYFLGIY